MRKIVNIDIPKPCQEDWGQMTAQEKGRHCQICSKLVYDFTKATDEQIVSTFEKETNLCGRFNASQLNRDIVLSRKEKSNYLSFAASGIFAFLSLNSHDAIAQGEPKIIQTDSLYPKQILGKVATSVLNERVISGTVISATDGLPLPGTNISIQNKSTSTYSDFDGNFKIRAKANDSIKFEYVGLKTMVLPVGDESTFYVALEYDEDSCLEEVVVGYPSYNYISDCERDKLKKQRKEKRAQIRNGEAERSSVGKFLYSISNIFRSKK